jgi:hypothetical protein
LSVNDCALANWCKNVGETLIKPKLASAIPLDFKKYLLSIIATSLFMKPDKIFVGILKTPRCQKLSDFIFFSSHLDFLCEPFPRQ